MKKGAVSRKVLFPAGEWINWNNPRLRYNGGQTALVKAPLSELPLFVRAGSFIPLYTEPIENVTQYNPQILTVRYYPAKEETEYTLFDDNRLSPTSLADGQYQLSTFTGRQEGEETVISLKAEGRYEGMPQGRLITFEVVGVRKPTSVTLGSIGTLTESASLKAIRQYGWHYDPRTDTLSIRLSWDYTTDTLTIQH